MEKTVSLIKKLLERVPYTVNMLEGFTDGCIYYLNNEDTYKIALCKTSDSKYQISFDIIRYKYPLYSKEFFFDVSEKEYMEIKWKFEEWNTYLNNRSLEQFEDFVNEEPDSSMDGLLND